MLSNLYPPHLRDGRQENCRFEAGLGCDMARPFLRIPQARERIQVWNWFWLHCLCLGNYSRREGTRGSSWSAQNTPRGNYNESRGGQSNFNRGPLPPLRPLSSAGTCSSLLVLAEISQLIKVIHFCIGRDYFSLLTYFRVRFISGNEA